MIIDVKQISDNLFGDTNGDVLEKGDNFTEHLLVYGNQFDTKSIRTHFFFCLIRTVLCTNLCFSSVLCISAVQFDLEPEF